MDVIEAKYVRDYVLWLRFEDGTQGEIDLEAELTGGVFEPLRERHYFQRFSVNPDTGTIEWPNRADFAPEFLLKNVKVIAAQ